MVQSNRRMTGATCTGCAIGRNKQRGVVVQQDLGSADKWHRSCYRLAQRIGVTMTAEQVGRGINDDEGWTHDAWTCTLTHDGRTLTTPYKLGTGWDHAYPGVLLVLEAMSMSESSLGETFDEWASDLGYDSDSRKALALYVNCQKEARSLHTLLGSDFQSVMDAVDKWAQS